MKRSLILTMALVLALALSSISAAFAQDDAGEDLLRITIRNRTGGPVSITLVGQDVFAAYILSVPTGDEQSFTVRSGSYDHTTFACGDSATGTLDVTRQVRLVFTPCFGVAPNSGAPSIEKVHLTDAPDGIAWLYQYDPTPQPGASPSPDGGISGTGPCQFSTGEDVTIYQRPSTAAGVFSEQGPGFSIRITARTADGWLGFDPAIAQAANIGSFRLRWIEPGMGTLTGNCGSLPVVWAPPPGICFDMPMETTPVRASPDASAAVLARLHVGEFAAVVGLNPAGDWAQVDLGPGNTGSAVVGWVQAGTLNVNGPCGSLPTVSP